MKGVFVTGIDTDAGKTVVAAIIAEAFQADYWKPVQCGNIDHTDTDTIKALTTSVRVRPETYCLTMPASPHAAATAEGITIDLARFVLPVTDRSIVVEGAGGLMVPLNDQHLIVDLIERLSLPVVLVSRHYLGSINHTLLSLATLHSRRLPVAGVIFAGEAHPSTEEAVVRFGSARILGRIPWAESVNRAFVANQAKQEWLHELC